MEYWVLNYCRDKIKQINDEQDRLKHKSTDVRKDFYSFIQPVLNNYYVGLTVEALCLSVGLSKAEIKLMDDGLLDHVNHLLLITKAGADYNNFISRAYRSLIIDSWSVFETCLNAILTHVLDDIQLHEFIYGEIPKKPNKKIQRLSKSEVTDKSIWKKYDKAFELVESSYGRDARKDREFLEFFGNLRNGLHSNFIHHGKYYEYQFKGITHYFKPGRGFTTSVIPDEVYYFDVVLELIAIYKEIAVSIDYPALIPYPDPNAPMP